MGKSNQIIIDNNSAYTQYMRLLAAQVAFKVTGNDTIEIDATGAALFKGSQKQQNEIQKLYDRHSKALLIVLTAANTNSRYKNRKDDLFAVYVLKNKLYPSA